jgi:hypothetical protein
MGRTGQGVEVRERSIRFTFLPGKPTLMREGSPLPPTPANVKYAHRLAAEIRDRIRHDTFSMAEYFPASGIAGALTVANQLDTWLGAQRVTKSTKAGYESAVRFWKGVACSDDGLKLGDLPLRALKHSHILTGIARRPDLSGKTVNNYVSVAARGDGIWPSRTESCRTTPVEGVPRAKHQKEPPDPFSRDEAEAIIADMAQHYPAQVRISSSGGFFPARAPVRFSGCCGRRWTCAALHMTSMRRWCAASARTPRPARARRDAQQPGAGRAQAAEGAHLPWPAPRFGRTRATAPRGSTSGPSAVVLGSVLKRLGIRYGGRTTCATPTRR